MTTPSDLIAIIKERVQSGECDLRDVGKLLTGKWDQDAPALLLDHIASHEGENTRLRAALAQSDRPCAYCSLPAEDWSKCQSGFPGCDRADDAMGCPELGASLKLAETEAALANVTETLSLKFFETQTRISSLEAENARLVKEVDALHSQGAETQMLAFKWMARHDRIAAGEDGGPFPKPTDVPDAIAALTAAEAERDALRAALEDAEDTLRLVERPAFRDPRYGDEVEALGLRIGFGALMASASASWREHLAADGDPVGGEFVAGPCHATVVSTLSKIRAARALSGKAPKSEDKP